MQRKYIIGLIALGFAISMELVLAVHLMRGAGDQSDRRSERRVGVISTIDIHKKSAGQETQEGPEEPQATSAAAFIAPEMMSAAEEFPTDVAPSDALPTGGAPDGYPAPDEPLVQGDPSLDDDHPPGSEPEDSDVPPQQDDGSWYNSDSYPAPGDDYYPPDDGYPAPDDDYPPDDSYPTPDPDADRHPTVEESPTVGAPTATSQATASTQQPTSAATAGTPGPTVTATKAATRQATATITLAATKQATAASTVTPTQPANAPATPTTTMDLAATPTAGAEPSRPAPTVTTAPTLPGAVGLVSARSAEAPKLDGITGDPAWEQAQAVTLQTIGGANQSAAQVTIRSVYDDEQVYFLVTWADPTRSLLMNPWEKQKDGSWKRLYGGENKDGDENEYYQDKLALMWPVDGSTTGPLTAGFAAQGCGTACHSGEEPKNKATGLMYTAEKGQLADLWQLKTVMNFSQVDDGYLDDTRYSKDNFWAGFHGDPGEGGYRTNRTKDGSAPAYMPEEGGDKSGAPGYILESKKEELDERLFRPGDRVPAVLKDPFEGDRGDIHAGWKYKDGTWTLEFARKLVTGSAHDVQFDDLEKTYFFALATFDNTQVRHAVQSGAVEFTFTR